MDEYLGAFAHQLAKNVIGPSCKENNYDLPLDDLHTHNEVENCRDILFNAEAYRWLCSQKARHWFPLTSFGASAILLAKYDIKITELPRHFQVPGTFSTKLTMSGKGNWVTRQQVQYSVEDRRKHLLACARSHIFQLAPA
ncbi:hypothetical protein M0657_011293 [Pyricularia oryzae]|nr:hypothetical protein M9X92_011353 [Pyricularia oryzae]KAI7910668.1 hypothetical protein M0657_011293 [Pyricularia oryzae]